MTHTPSKQKRSYDAYGYRKRTVLISNGQSRTSQYRKVCYKESIESLEMKGPNRMKSIFKNLELTNATSAVWRGEPSPTQVALHQSFAGAEVVWSGSGECRVVAHS
jgi:hypothetical protein